MFRRWLCAWLFHELSKINQGELLMTQATDNLTAAVDRLTTAVNAASTALGSVGDANVDAAVVAQTARVDALATQLFAATPVPPPATGP